MTMKIQCKLHDYDHLNYEKGEDRLVIERTKMGLTMVRITIGDSSVIVVGTELISAVRACMMS